MKHENLHQHFKEKMQTEFKKDHLALKEKLASMMGPDAKCKDLECFNEISTMVGDVVGFCVQLANHHGIEPNAMMIEVFTTILEGAKKAQVQTEIYKQFQDHDQVGLA